MMKRFLAFLPLAGIVTACSSGVVDTWDPKAEVARQEATKQSKKAKCEKMKENPTHATPYGQESIRQGRSDAENYMYYLDGNDFYSLRPCQKVGVIGKTKEWTSNSGTVYTNKYLLQDGEVVHYSRPKKGSQTVVVGRYLPLNQ